MSSRFTKLDPANLPPEQKAVYDVIAAGKRKAVPYIYHALLGSPELAQLTQQLGVYCRYGTEFTARQSELAVLVVAQHFQAAYEWSVHVEEARKAGLPENVIAAVEKGEKPEFADPDDELIYRFSKTYFEQNDVPDDIFVAAEARFGKKAVIELAGILGFYSMLAIVLRIYRVPPQDKA